MKAFHANDLKRSSEKITLLQGLCFWFLQNHKDPRCPSKISAPICKTYVPPSSMVGKNVSPDSSFAHRMYVMRPLPPVETAAARLQQALLKWGAHRPKLQGRFFYIYDWPTDLAPPPTSQD